MNDPSFSRVEKHSTLLRAIGRVWLARRPLARLLSTLLCSLIIVIRPFSRLGGQYAFLVLALKELVFSVQENLAQQLELTFLNILGALIGIGISTLAKHIASLAGHDTPAARATCACFLILMSFLGESRSLFPLPANAYSICVAAGIVKSRLVRLQLSTRISCFISVWLLTNNIGVSNVGVQSQKSSAFTAELGEIVACPSRFGRFLVDHSIGRHHLLALSPRNDDHLSGLGHQLRAGDCIYVCSSP